MNSDRHVATEGIILRSVDYSETSKIATLFTRNTGKMAVMAKGGRRLKSRFEVSLDVLSVCSICAIRKPSAELDLLTEAVLVERFAGFRTDLRALNAGYYIAETLDGLTHRDEPHPLLYDATKASLRRLSEGDDRLPTLCEWIIRCVVDLGYGPNLEGCVQCGKTYAGLKKSGYSIRAGGLVCRQCVARWPDVQTLRGETVDWMKSVAEDREPAKLASGALRGELWRVCSMHIEHLLHRRPKTAAWLDMN